MALPVARQASSPSRLEVHVVHREGAADRCEPDGGAHRKVDAADQQNQGLAGDSNQDDRKLTHNVLEIADRHESVDREREHNENDDDDRKHRNVANDIQKQPKTKSAWARRSWTVAAHKARTTVIEMMFEPCRFCHFAQPHTLPLVVEEFAFVYSRPGRSWTRSLSAIFL